MYEATCHGCLFAELCARDCTCSNYTPSNDEENDLRIIEAGREQFRSEWWRYAEED